LINLGDALSFWSGNQLKATLHRVTFDGLLHDKERQSMAYFGAANPDTVLQPLLSGVTMGEYLSNGLRIEPGITVGELNRQIMTSIYGPALAT
jgi:isopenicillin N synthase-like dioxygenase